MPKGGNEALDIVRRQQTKSADALPSLPQDPLTSPTPDMPTLPDAAPPPPQVSTAVEPVIEQEVASLPPAPGIDKKAAKDTGKGEKSLSVVFAQTETEVPLASQAELRDLARQLTVDKDKSVTVMAYASAPEEQSSLARRVSLARALAVRAFLIDLGVDNIRITIQPRGNNIPEGGGPTERADVLVK